MNRTSRGSRLVSSAARSPALAITGPEVARKLTPSSRATICASVVLPRPGGPTKQHVVERFLARARGLDENLQIGARLSWPMKSASRCGRSEASASSSAFSGVRSRRGVFISPAP